MSDESHSFRQSDEAIAEDAAAWLVRRDRGFTPGEQDEFFQWRQADPRHRAALSNLESAWRALDSLSGWCPGQSSVADPDLLSRPPRRASAWRSRVIYSALGAAAALAVSVYVASPSQPRSGVADTTLAGPALRVIPAPEQLTLSDGSLVSLNRDTRIEPQFSATERRLRMAVGEAHFAVAKNPSRPFVVEIAGVTVRAIGTAFSVRHAQDRVEVVVTEGTVEVDRASAVLPTTAEVEAAPALAIAGEKVTIDAAVSGAKAVVVQLTSSEMDRALAWQGVRLEFAGLPLSEVVMEFNLRNRKKLVIGDAETGRIRVGGSFRADNVEGFVRLLEDSFGLMARPGELGEVVLIRRR
jgi:transmembrane sensor